MIFHPYLFEATQNYAPEMLFGLSLEDYVATLKERVAERRQNALMLQTGQKSEGSLINEVDCFQYKGQKMGSVVPTRRTFGKSRRMVTA